MRGLRIAAATPLLLPWEHGCVAGRWEQLPECTRAQVLTLLTRMIAQQVDLEPGEFVWMGGDVHLYLNHAHLVTEQLAREPQGRPRLEIVRRPDSVFGYRIEDFEVHGYTPHGAIAAPVAV